MKNILLFTLLTASSFVFSQKQPTYYDAYQPVKRSSIGFNLGPTAFHGDADGTMLGIFGGLIYKYSFSPSLGLCFGGNLGVLRGSRDKSKISISGFGNSWDKDEKGDQYTFKNKFWDIDATAHLVVGNMSFVRKPKPSHFYLLAGMGLMGNNVTGDLSGDSKRALFGGNRNFNDTSFSFKGVNSKVPVGFGFSKKISNKFDLGLEYKYNLTKKDLIDGFSFSTWKNRTFDSYSTLGIIFSYKLGKTDNTTHMDWVSPTDKMIEDKSNEVSDTDGDGVVDKYDAEPGTPKGAMVYGNGVAVDSDQDGVPDYRDDEVLSVCNAVDGKGVAYDGDGDGIVDCKDEEANTPEGSLVDKTGRKVDIQSGASSSSCCDCNDVSLPSVFVDEDNEFRPEAYSALYLIGVKLQQCPDVSVDIIGYYGMNKSSEQSARAKTNLVIEHLVTNFGIPRTKFNVLTKPETLGGKYSKQRIDIKSKK
jgi:hypothetical protein